MNTVPRLLRFSHLKERNIVTSWPQLRRLVQAGFPTGVMLSHNTRVWSEGEVVRWLEGRGLKVEIDAPEAAAITEDA